MKIIIFSPTYGKIDPVNPMDQPIGGADYTLIQLCESLAEKHDVEAYIAVKNPIEHHKVNYRRYMDLFDKETSCDIMILYRKMWSIPPNIKYKKLLFYSQDMPHTPCFSGLQKTGFNDQFDKFDRIIALSEFHKAELYDAFRIPHDKFKIIGNAADIILAYSPRKPLKFIYGSTPYRGLGLLGKMWSAIKAEFPEATLDIYSSMKIYGDMTNDELIFKKMYQKIGSLPGVSYYGSVPKRVFLEALNDSWMLLYPNTYPETYCNLINEARACQVPFITSSKGALPTTGCRGGLFVLVDPIAFPAAYEKEFIEKLRICVHNKDLYDLLSREAVPCRTWDEYKKDIQRLVEDELDGK